MKRNIFKKAHELTKKIIRKGDNYRATFRLCLSFVYSQVKGGVKDMIEYVTSRGTKVIVKLGEGRTVQDLTINGIKVIEDNYSDNNCFLGEGYIFVTDSNAYRKLGLNRMAQVEMGEELTAIYNGIREKEMAKFNKELNKEMKIARDMDEFNKKQYSTKRHFNDVNYVG